MCQNYDKEQKLILNVSIGTTGKVTSSKGQRTFTYKEPTLHIRNLQSPWVNYQMQTRLHMNMFNTF